MSAIGHVLVRRDGAVLSRLAQVPDGPMPELFWSDAQTTISTGYRFAVVYPSREAADKAGAIYGAEPAEFVRAEFNGLQPGTEYAYRAGMHDDWGTLP